MGYALLGLQMVGNAMSTYQQSKKQEEYYRQQADLLTQKANETQKQAEIDAENDAYAQKKRNDQMRIIRGQAAAAAGSAGVTNEGSFQDLLNAAQDEYEQDTVRALSNTKQKQSQFSNTINGYKANSTAYTSAANRTVSQRPWQMVGTIAGGLASMYSAGAFGGAQSNFGFSGSVSDFTKQLNAENKLMGWG